MDFGFIRNIVLLHGSLDCKGVTIKKQQDLYEVSDFEEKHLEELDAAVKRFILLVKKNRKQK
jgi:hypothetical protein